MSNAYLDLLKQKTANIKTASASPRRQALIDQGGVCAKCKKDLNPAFAKFIEGHGNTFTVICSDCAIEIPKR